MPQRVNYVNWSLGTLMEAGMKLPKHNKHTLAHTQHTHTQHTHTHTCKWLHMLSGGTGKKMRAVEMKENFSLDLLSEAIHQ